jgi:endonuclease YncB( thermonuclease family)
MGTKPVGIKPIALIAIVALAFAIHAYRRDVARSTHALPPAPTHADIVGKAWVIDGDTVDISGARIRMEGIDAPESAQSCTDLDHRPWPCGRAATRELRDHLGGRPLRCASGGLDRYGRILAVCALPDGSDVNAWMVRQGWALAYGYSALYRSEEAEARAAKRGIWAGNFVVPWEWRHHHIR